MIERLLIANRGEVVSRIARTARSMGIATVGVYSEPDRNATHTAAVDLAVALGGASPADSYLRREAVIRAALDTGCDAVHPGYGFLAENADFAEAVVDASLVWVGPTPGQIRLLGDKIAAKRVALEAGVPTAPIVEFSADFDLAGFDAATLRYPVMVKAAAGGGGRGLRIVAGPGELAEAVAAASREAASAFGDGTVFVEPFVEAARHIEVQIIGDAHGTVVHLGERECSIQRRNQKIVEEAPSAGLDEGLRARLHDGALALARHVGYRNAGTVEFMVSTPIDGEPTVSLLEVNTRLQVEHRVTELVTGLDLVELQLRVAAGEPLGLRQDDVRTSGHAIEARVVAEDPARGWLPSTGTITEYTGGPPDSAVATGSVVSVDYDSLLANVVVAADTRPAAAAELRRALGRFRIGGVRTNVATLLALLGEPDFLAGRTTTAYLDEHPALAFAASVTGDELDAHLLAAVFVDESRNRAADPATGFAPSGWRNLRTVGQRRTWLLDGQPHQVEYVIDGDRATVDIGEWPTPTPSGVLSLDERRRRAVRLLQRAPGQCALELDGVRRVVEITDIGEAVTVRSSAGSTTWTRPPRFADHGADEAGSGPVCPLPGTVIAVHVEPGQAVTEGAALMVIEAMKMEHTIRAAVDGVVSEVRFAVGDRVDAGELLVVLD